MNETDIMNYNVAGIGLSAAIYNALYRGGIRTVADLLESMEDGTINSDIRSIGPKSREQICMVMSGWLKDDFPYEYRESDGKIGRRFSQEKPCDYCSYLSAFGDEANDYLFVIGSQEISPWLHFDISSYIQNGKLRIRVEDDASIAYFEKDFDISYCPMCGKKLKKEEK